MSIDPVPNQPTYAMAAGAEGRNFSDDGGPGSGADPFSHAPGRTCAKCDRRIEARQPARRKGEDSWVHDVCPEF